MINQSKEVEWLKLQNLMLKVKDISGDSGAIEPKDHVHSTERKLGNGDADESGCSGSGSETELQNKMKRLFPQIADINQQIRSAISSVNHDTFELRMKQIIVHYLNGVRYEFHNASPLALKCCQLAVHLMRTIDLLHTICTSIKESEVYQHRMCELLGYYVSCELCAAHGMDVNKLLVTQRIMLVITSYLKSSFNEKTKENFLRMLVFMPETYNEHEIMSRIYSHFIPRPTIIIQIELPDKIYIQYLIVFYLWTQMAPNSTERQHVLEFADKFMRPALTLASNANYAIHLPKYTKRQTATRFIIENLKFFKDLRNASIFDNQLSCPSSIIDLDDDILDRKLSAISLPTDDLNFERTVKPKWQNIKLENPTTVDEIDLTNDDDLEKPEEDWIVRLKRKAVLMKPDERINAILNCRLSKININKTDTNKSPTHNDIEVIVIDDNNSEHESTLDEACHEPDMFSLDFGSHVSTNKSGSTTETIVDCTQVSCNFPIDSGTYGNVKEPKKSKACDVKIISNVLITSPKCVASLSTNEQQGTEEQQQQYSVPYIDDSYSCRRESLHLISSPCQTSHNLFNDALDDDDNENSARTTNASNQNNNIEENLDSSQFCFFGRSETKLTSTKIVFSQQVGTENTALAHKKSTTSYQMNPQKSYSKSSPNKKQVKFNEFILGPTPSATSPSDFDRKVPIKPAIIKTPKASLNVHKSLGILPKPLSPFSSKSSSKSSSPISSSLSHRGQKEHNEAISTVFAKYKSIETNNNTPSSPVNKVNSITSLEEKPKTRERKSTARKGRKSRKFFVEDEKSCAAFYNFLLEKQREKMHLHALERERKRKLLIQPNINEEQKSIAEESIVEKVENVAIADKECQMLSINATETFRTTSKITSTTTTPIKPLTIHLKRVKWKCLENNDAMISGKKQTDDIDINEEQLEYEKHSTAHESSTEEQVAQCSSDIKENQNEITVSIDEASVANVDNKPMTSLSLLANEAAKVLPQNCEQNNKIGPMALAGNCNEEHSVECDAVGEIMLAHESDAVGLLNIEVASPTVPVYLLNGESRDVPTPTPLPLGHAEAVLVAPALATKDMESNTAADTPMVFDNSLISHDDDNEVTSTQECNDEVIRKKNRNVVIKNVEYSPKPLILQNNQVDTTHHLPNMGSTSPGLCDLRRKRNRSLNDDFSTNPVVERRRSYCPESFVYVENNFSNSPVTTIKNCIGFQTSYRQLRPHKSSPTASQQKHKNVESTTGSSGKLKKIKNVELLRMAEFDVSTDACGAICHVFEKPKINVIEKFRKPPKPPAKIEQKNVEHSTTSTRIVKRKMMKNAEIDVVKIAGSKKSKIDVIEKSKTASKPITKIEKKNVEPTTGKSGKLKGKKNIVLKKIAVMDVCPAIQKSKIKVIEKLRNPAKPTVQIEQKNLKPKKESSAILKKKKNIGIKINAEIDVINVAASGAKCHAIEKPKINIIDKSRNPANPTAKIERTDKSKAKRKFKKFN